MYFKNSRILSSIAVIVGSGFFWIVQDGCDKRDIITPGVTNPARCSAGKYYASGCSGNPLSCTNVQIPFPDNEAICSKSCTSTLYKECSVCSTTTIYGTVCQKVEKIQEYDVFGCDITSDSDTSYPSTCTQKICGSSTFLHDCSDNVSCTEQTITTCSNCYMINTGPEYSCLSTTGGGYHCLVRTCSDGVTKYFNCAVR